MQIQIGPDIRPLARWVRRNGVHGVIALSCAGYIAFCIGLIIWLL